MIIRTEIVTVSGPATDKFWSKRCELMMKLLSVAGTLSSFLENYVGVTRAMDGIIVVKASVTSLSGQALI